MTGSHLLCALGIHKRYDDSEGAALRGVDLEVPSGEILVLLGTSGAGKTTLLRIVAGLDEADEGRVTVGERVLSDPKIRVPPERRGVGLVFQHLELWPHMTVAENIAFGLQHRPRGRRALRHPVVTELARQVGVMALLSRSPATLSGGERQRVAIARTLAPQPAVILYDEPLANLDPERRSDLRRLIRRLSRLRNATLVYVTHDADEAMEMGDEIAVLHRGRVVDRGPPERLYNAPTSLAGGRALGPLTALAADIEHGRARTVLGSLEVTGAVESGRAVALVRPEAVHVTEDGVEAEILDARPQGARWRFEARVAETTVRGESAQPLETGRSVRLSAHGPVAVVAGEEEA